MSKPVLIVNIATLDEKSLPVRAVIDTESFYTIIREDKVPSAATIARRATPQECKTAEAGGWLRVVGEVSVVITIGAKMISDSALVAPDLGQEMLVGAKTMQAWDISIHGGQTSVIGGRDMSDPDITEVDRIRLSRRGGRATRTRVGRCRSRTACISRDRMSSS